MPLSEFLHDSDDFEQLINLLFRQKNIRPQLIEKDYWLMHALWGMQNQGFAFALKGGTSLSKGWGIIERFSEDVDIQIEPPPEMDVKTGKNQDKPSHIKSREIFFQWIFDKLSIPGMESERDLEFDDADKRNAGIRLLYPTRFEWLEGVKPYVLLEIGFDVTTPNEPLDCSSWVYEHASSVESGFVDNRALAIPCYYPEYTLIEKLNAISRKFRQQQQNTTMPINFLRHYHDVYELLGQERVIKFIGSPEYVAHKATRFRAQDQADLTKNEAFILSDPSTRSLYAKAYQRGANLYYAGQPSFEKILGRIGEFISRMCPRSQRYFLGSLMAAKHTHLSTFGKRGLFQHLKSFSELEQRISALPSENERGNAFEVFAEAYLATQSALAARFSQVRTGTPGVIS